MALAQLNVSDIPELLKGARPSASSARREQFETRCQELYRDEVAEDQHEAHDSRASVGGISSDELEQMFPTLDPGLIRCLRTEAASAEQAIDTLLALSAAMAEPRGAARDGASSAPLPPRSLGVEDHSLFPTLMDADGWQVMSFKAQAAEEDLGNSWRDRARAATDKPAPQATPKQAFLSTRRRQKTRKESGEEEQPPLTDYECRHRLGERRARNRAEYGRRVGRGGAGLAGPRSECSGAASDPAREADEQDFAANVDMVNTESGAEI